MTGRHRDPIDHVTPVEECGFDRGGIPHEINRFDLHHKSGDVMKLADVPAHFERASGP